MQTFQKLIMVAAGVLVVSGSSALAQAVGGSGATPDGNVPGVGGSPGNTMNETGSANGSQSGMSKDASPTRSAPDSTGPRGATPSGAAGK